MEDTASLHGEMSPKGFLEAQNRPQNFCDLFCVTRSPFCSELVRHADHICKRDYKFDSTLKKSLVVQILTGKCIIKSSVLVHYKDLLFYLKCAIHFFIEIVQLLSSEQGITNHWLASYNSWFSFFLCYTKCTDPYCTYDGWVAQW